MTDRTASFRDSLEGLREREGELLAELEVVRQGITALTYLLGYSTAAAQPTAPELAPTAPTPAAPYAPASESEETESDPGQPGQQVSIAKASEQVLRGSGRHMRARDIAAGMIAQGLRTDGDLQRLRDSVGAILARRAGEQKVFSRRAKGLFGLVEWAGLGPRETQTELDAEIQASGENDD